MLVGIHYKDSSKKIGLTYRRIRKSPAKKPDAMQYLDKKADLKTLQGLADTNLLDLVYFDESGITKNPDITSCWQIQKEPTFSLPSATNRKRISMLGFLNVAKQTLRGYTTTDKVDSAFVISIMSDYANTITKRTVVVLDNASFHKSRRFKEHISKWQEKGLYLFYLPPYSPQLNPIEILWRFIKQEWINLNAYLSFDALYSYIDNVFSGYGTKYVIDFG